MHTEWFAGIPAGLSAAVMLATAGITLWVLFRLRRAGVFAEVNQETRWSAHRKPPVGGILIFMVVGLAVVGLSITAPERFTGESFAMLAALTVAYLTGYIDDLRNINPGLKAGGQLLAGILLVLGLGTVELTGIPALDVLLTLLLVSALTNSLNMLDNLDGVLGITSGLAIVFLLGMGLLTQELSGFEMALALAVLGGLVVFLSVNIHPSQVYMGDSGALLLGAYVAARIIPLAQHQDGEAVMSTLFLIGLVLLVPLFDTTIVIVDRLYRRVSPFAGGRNHTTHHLCYNGVHQRFVPWLLGLLGLNSGILVLLALRAKRVTNWEVLLLLVAYLGLAAVLTVVVYRRGGRLNRAK